MSITQLYKACRAAEAILADDDESAHDSLACGGPSTCVLCQVREAIIKAQEEDPSLLDDELIPMARLHPIDE